MQSTCRCSGAGPHILGTIAGEGSADLDLWARILVSTTYKAHHKSLPDSLRSLQAGFIVVIAVLVVIVILDGGVLTT